MDPVRAPAASNVMQLITAAALLRRRCIIFDGGPDLCRRIFFFQMFPEHSRDRYHT